jgi:hypothetical protein
MKLKLIIIVVFITIISCKRKEEVFDVLEYSYAGTFSTVFSLKFTESDTIYLREHWNKEWEENIKYPKAKTNYFAIITEQQKNELRNLVEKIDFKKIETEYYENYSDGSSFEIIIKKGKFEKKVNVHSYKIPSELDTLANWINETKDNLKLTKTNKKLIFKSANGVLPPPPPPNTNN